MVIATGIVLLLVWVFVGGGAYRSGVDVVRGSLYSETSLTLWVDECNGAPTVSRLTETDDHVRVEVVAYQTLLGDELHCLDEIRVGLTSPLGERPLIDGHSGQTVSLTSPSGGQPQDRFGTPAE